GNGVLPTGWPVNGKAITTASGSQYLNDIISDGTGGAFIAWESGIGARVQHVLADGTLALGWPVAGVSVSTFYTTDYLYDGHLAPDGYGGVYAIVSSNQYGYVFLQHIAANGQIAAGWPAQGI